MLEDVGIPQKIAKSENGLPFVDDKGNYNPKASEMDQNKLVWQRPIIHDNKVHGEKEW